MRQSGHSGRMAEVGVDDAKAVVSWLAAHGFDQVAAHESASFGDRHEDWQRGDSLIRSVRDRGQWFILVGHSDWDDWFDIDLVAYVCEFRKDTVLGRVKSANDREIGHLLPALRSARSQIAAHPRGVPQRHGPPQEDS
jgi:hypothetical protein